MVQTVQTFRMSDDKVAARSDVRSDAINYRFLGGFVEIDHHIPAENIIETILERIFLRHQIKI